MTLLSKTELQSLITAQRSPCVSIYLPTHEAGREIRQDPIRLKNQLSEAEKQLTQKDFGSLGKTNMQQLLKPAYDLLEDTEFWQHQNAGLALFLAPGEFRYYRVPSQFDALTVVEAQFYTKPLLPLVTDDSQFYVLAASQNKVSLYQATRDSVHLIDLGNTPLSAEVALRYDDPEASLQGHSSGGGGKSTIFHGQGGSKDTQNSDILRFFHLVSDGVQDVLARQAVPLVFMGVDFLFPIYKQANHYPHLMAEAVSFQPDQLSPEEIRDRALAIVEPYFNANRQETLEAYGSLKDKDQATDDLKTILNASHDGQIDTLLIAASTQIWGSFDASTRQIDRQLERKADSQDLLNLAATQALFTDAKVYVLDRADMPDNADAAATLRYPIVQESLVTA